MKAAFLLNPSPRWKNRLPRLARQLEAFPFPKEIFTVDRAEYDSMEKHLQRIVQDKFDRIVVVGGDGSLNRAVNFLQNVGCADSIALGVLPFGTCNDFARTLGYRRGEIRRPLRAAAQGRLLKVRIARVNGRYFINNAGFGKKNPTEKRKSLIAVIREMRPVSAEARWPGQTMAGNFLMMLCANAPYFSGGLRFSRKSNPTDDLLEFYFVKKMPKISLALRLLFGRARLPLRLPLSRHVLKIQAPRLILRTDPPVAIVADGDPVPELSSARDAVFEIAGACNFLVP